MDREVLSQSDAMSVGEAGGVSVESARALTDAHYHELDMVFTFALIGLGRDGEAPRGLLPRMRRVIAERDRAASDDGWVPPTWRTMTSPAACRISATPTPPSARPPPRSWPRCC